METHSEHLLRRLRRRIAEDVIAPDMVSVYHASIGEAATLEHIEINEFGSIVNWPDSFYDDEDLIALLKAASRKRKRKRT